MKLLDILDFNYRYVKSTAHQLIIASELTRKKKPLKYILLFRYKYYEMYLDTVLIKLFSKDEIKEKDPILLTHIRKNEYYCTLNNLGFLKKN